MGIQVIISVLKDYVNQTKSDKDVTFLQTGMPPLQVDIKIMCHRTITLSLK